MKKEYFILNDVSYKIVSSGIGVYETNEGIQLFPK